MGTRGAWGFRQNKTDKVTYNHWDSYPKGLGLDFFRALKEAAIDAIHSVATKLRVVKGDDVPSKEDLKKYKHLHDREVGSGHEVEGGVSWYQLIRGAQGEISDYVNGKVDVIEDGASFLLDSLFCEWAYILNLDTGMLEVYKGFNSDRNAPGRYASLQRERGGEYVGVSLLLSFRLSMLAEMSEDDFTNAIHRECRVRNPEDYDDEEDEPVPEPGGTETKAVVPASQETETKPPPKEVNGNGKCGCGAKAKWTIHTPWLIGHVPALSCGVHLHATMVGLNKESIDKYREPSELKVLPYTGS